MFEVSTVPLEEALSIGGFKQLTKQLSALPTSEQFQKKAEKELWRAVTNSEEEKISYEELSESSRKFIGYVPSPEEGGKDDLPWWLQSFTWKIKLRGSSNSHTLNVDFIKEKLENFPTDSELLRPSLIESDFLALLQDFHSIKEEIENRLDFEIKTGESFSSMPDRFFEKSNNRIRTTEEFKRWFDEIINLCPPAQPQLTTVLLLSSQINTKMAEQSLEEKMVKKLIDIGIASEDQIYNDKLFLPTVKTTGLRKIFDLVINYPEGFEEFKELSPLQVLFFIAFKDSLSDLEPVETNKIKKWITKSIVFKGLGER